MLRMAQEHKIRDKVGVLMFEFSRFWPSDYKHGRDFVAEPDLFLGKLPKGWTYAIEMRNRAWLRPECFDSLARHGITHVFNSWNAMPAIGEQMALAGSRTNPGLVAARFLLKPGRSYEQAVKAWNHTASSTAVASRANDRALSNSPRHSAMCCWL